MSFKREKIHNYYLHDTFVENVFINEYMIDAPGDYVKVYLFALMYAEIRMSMSNESIAKQLSLAEEDVLKAWTYWEEKGVIKKHFSNEKDRFHYKVELLNLKEQIYGKNGKAKSSGEELPEALKGLLNDHELKRMYSRIEQSTGRLFEGREPAAILEWIRDYNVRPDLIVFAYDYCTKKRNNNKVNYIAAVVKEWASKGLRTVSQVESYLAETDSRHYLYKRVLKALGFHRNATEEEKRIMDTWFDQLGADITKVLSACSKTSGISNPNINYVNSILRSWYSESKPKVSGQAADSVTPIGQVMRSYEEERAENEKAAELRREEVFKAVPRIKEIEEEIRSVGLDISKEMLAGGSESRARIKALKNSLESLQNEKSYLLTDNNFKIDYMDVWYTCNLCKDTGILDNGQRCTCFTEKLERLGKKV